MVRNLCQYVAKHRYSSTLLVPFPHDLFLEQITYVKFCVCKKCLYLSCVDHAHAVIVL